MPSEQAPQDYVILREPWRLKELDLPCVRIRPDIGFATWLLSGTNQ